MSIRSRARWGSLRAAALCSSAVDGRGRGGPDSERRKQMEARMLEPTSLVRKRAMEVRVRFILKDMTYRGQLAM
ncbi:MAG: hypothetical protein ACKV22_35260 [Bryobacteraceae bacterium]